MNNYASPKILEIFWLEKNKKKKMAQARSLAMLLLWNVEFLVS